ncbi:hypothetical protein [Micromonospora sagamiensis]|uniref:Uncharacterized protein n=1 Tax=Micromonospora sagamiensis TaxID=47875 RepID=A0A562WLM6_9ACTN|nr:hypothetical protein [Micromonospora sagamiensis]TWJ31096.1 hypothetical protein JD81_04648 [Micromonospora sagamiensis]BCL15861.1 hypothetical protein GCM10017556_36000 [Micromonospora sagamiensis]
MAEAAIVLNTTAGLTGFINGQAKGLTEGLFQVTGFNDARFEKEMPLEMLASPNPLGDKQVVMVRGSQSVDHVYWLRYLRRGIGVTDKKRVCVELLVRFTTFDYVPKADQKLRSRDLAALTDYPMWGISGLSISLMATGRGRNPFNKFNEVGSLIFDTAPVTSGLPHFRINYRVQHQAKTVMGATLALNHNDVGAFLVHSNGLLEIAPGEGRTEKHFRITHLSGQVHNRPSVIGAAQNAPVGKVSLLSATQITRGAGQDANALAAHEHDSLRVVGFDQLNGPDTITVDSAAANGVLARAGQNGRQGAVRLEYVRNGSVLGSQVRTKIRVLLLLRYTLVHYFTDPDQSGNRQVVQQNGVRYASFRDVSLTVLDTVAGDPVVVGDDGTKYDIKAIKNRFHETSTLRFGARIEEVNGQVGAQVKINWRAQHAGAVGKSQSHDNFGNLRLGVDQSGNPVLRLLDQDSNKYFTVTG